MSNLTKEPMLQITIQDIKENNLALIFDNEVIFQGTINKDKNMSSNSTSSNLEFDLTVKLTRRVGIDIIQISIEAPSTNWTWEDIVKNLPNNNQLMELLKKQNKGNFLNLFSFFKKKELKLNLGRLF